MNKKKHLSLSIDKETLLKLHCVAKYYKRSANGQVMSLIDKSIRDYEKQHGLLNLPVDEEVMP